MYIYPAQIAFVKGLDRNTYIIKHIPFMAMAVSLSTTIIQKLIHQNNDNGLGYYIISN